MNDLRVRELIDAYGADDKRWPEDERNAALTVCAQSPELRAYRAEAEALDGQLDGYQVPSSASVESLLAQLDDLRADSVDVSANTDLNWLERWVDWLFPTRFADTWRPVLAASMPVVAGLYLNVAGLLVPVETDWSESERALFNVSLDQELDAEIEQ